MNPEREINHNLMSEIKGIMTKAETGEVDERKEAIRQLGIVGNGMDPETEPVCEKLINLTGDSDPQIRVSAIEAIKGIGQGANYWYPEKFEPKIESEEDQARWDFRKERCQRIAKVLLPKTEDKDSEVRKTALKGIGSLGFGGFMTNEIETRLWQAFETEPELAKIANEELVKMEVHDERLVNNLLEGLTSQDPYERGFAVWGLGRIGGKEVIGSLLRLKETLKDDDPVIKSKEVDFAIYRIKKEKNEQT